MVACPQNATSATGDSMVPFTNRPTNGAPGLRVVNSSASSQSPVRAVVSPVAWMVDVLVSLAGPSRSSK